jgi:hypothetical protein
MPHTLIFYHIMPPFDGVYPADTILTATRDIWILEESAGYNLVLKQEISASFGRCPLQPASTGNLDIIGA